MKKKLMTLFLSMGIGLSASAIGEPWRNDQEACRIAQERCLDNGGTPIECRELYFSCVGF